MSSVIGFKLLVEATVVEVKVPLGMINSWPMVISFSLSKLLKAMISFKSALYFLAIEKEFRLF